MRAKIGVLAVSCLICCGAALGTSATVRGNSSYGTGDGSGSWDLANSNPNPTVNGVVIGEQTVCSAENVGQSCGGSTGNDFTYLFQLQSSISGAQISFSGLSTGALFGVMACNESSGNGPGPLCTDLTALDPSLGCSLTTSATTSTCTGVTYDGTDPVFTVTGNGEGLTFYVTESGATVPSVCINGVCSGTAPTPTPEPSSLGILSAGLLTLWWRRRAKGQASSN
jgi:hypothetical protein